MLLRDVSQTAEAYHSGKAPSVLARATWRRNQAFGARMLLAMFSLMAPLTPKAMHADNWPLDKAE